LEGWRGDANLIYIVYMFKIFLFKKLIAVDTKLNLMGIYVWRASLKLVERVGL
jgi:hypothetical protein